MNFVTKWFF